MSARKKTVSTPCTPYYMKSCAVPNTKRVTKCPNMTLSEPVVTDPSHSQKYMQHQLDLAYNKYIQNLALESILTKTHKEAERSYDEQLAHYQEIHETASEELQSKYDYISDVTTAMENDAKLKFLESSLEDLLNCMEEKKIIEKTERINENLQLICDNLNFENISFVSSEENYIKLQNTLQEMSKVLDEVNEDNSEDFNTLVENIFKARDLLTKIRKNHELAKNYQNKLNKLVLKTASIELSKLDENEQNSDITMPMQL